MGYNKMCDGCGDDIDVGYQLTPESDILCEDCLFEFIRETECELVYFRNGERCETYEEADDVQICYKGELFDSDEALEDAILCDYEYYKINL